MKRNGKLIVIFLSFALVFAAAAIATSASTSASGNVAKVGEVEYATLTDAINAATSDEKVTLISDASISDYSLSKTVTLDLNGYTLSSDGGTTLTAFTLLNGASLSITGDGTVNIDGSLAVSTASGVSLSVKGAIAGIDLNHTGKASLNIINTKGGTWSFSNVDMKIVTNKGYSFKMTDNSSSKFEFSAVTIDNTASSDVATSSALIRQSKAGRVSLDHCTVNANTAFIIFQTDSASYDSSNNLTATETTVEDYLVIKNSWISSINTSVKSGLFGSYSCINNDIYVENSYLESSYRAVMLKDTGHGELILNNSYLVVDNCNALEKNSYFLRSGAIRVGAGSSLSADMTAAVIKNSSGNVKFASNAPSVIYLEEGARLNYDAFNILTTLTASGSYYVAENETYVKFVELDESGNETYVAPSASSMYTFVYDPIGNSTAPYVVTKISDFAPALYTKDESGNITADTVNKPKDSQTLSDYVYFYHDGRTRTGQLNQYETIDESKKYISHGTKYVNGNACYYYAPNGYIAVDSETGADTGINFWLGLSTGISETALDVFVYEFDLATNSADGFAPGYVSINARTGAKNDGSETSCHFFHVAADGTVTSDYLTGFEGYTLKTNGWNRVSVVIETSTSLGRAHVFIDGNYLGYATGYSQDNSYLYAMRYDSTVLSRNIVGPVTLFDNIGIRTFGSGSGSYTVSGESDARAYLTGGGMPQNFGNTVSRALADITVGGIEYGSISEAASAAAAIGTVAQLNADIAREQTISAPCIVSANGHTINLSDAPVSCVQVTDSNGKVIYYEFSVDYDGELIFHWQIGNILTGEYADVTTTVKTGAYPEYDFNEDKWIYNDTEKKIYKQVGWNGVDTETALTYQYVQEVLDGANAGHVYATPKVEIYDIAQVVLDANGNAVAASESTDIVPGGIFYTFTSNQTYKLHRDCIMSRELGSVARTFQGGVFGMDLNGCKLTIEHSALLFKIGKNCTLNVYSSAPGGTIYRPGEADGTSVRGNALFHIAPISDSDAKIENNVTTSTHKAVLNIGTISGIDGAIGSNLTVTGDCVIEARSGDESCAANVDGATLIRQGQAYGALIYPRFYNGSITVKNATLINTSNNYILTVPASYLNAVGFKYSATAILEGCTVIQSSSSAAAIGATTGFDSITINNCIFSGHIYENSTDVDASKIKSLETVAMTAKPAHYESEDWPKYNVTFDTLDTFTLFGEEGYYKTKQLSVSGGKLVETDCYIVCEGADTSFIPEGAVIMLLPALRYMSAVGKETVSVVWNDFDGAVLKTEAYVKGGNVCTADVSVPDSTTGLVATKKVFKSWGELPENLSSDAVINPLFELRANLKGMKHNLSLYSDFCVNVYIPVVYGDNVTIYTDSERNKPLSFTRVSIEDTDYLKVVVGQRCYLASEEIVFYFTVKETVDGEIYSVDIDIPLSISGYSRSILECNDETYSLADKVLICYMLDYANEAAKYFTGVDNDEVISALLEEYNTYYLSYSEDIPYASLNEGLSGVFEGAAVQLDSSPAFVIDLKAGFVGTVTVSYLDGSVVRVFNDFETVATTEDNRSIMLDNMKVYNFGSDLTITATGALNGEAVSVSGRYNFDSYVEYAEENNMAHFNLVDSLRTYSQVSKYYKAGTLGEHITDYGRLVISAPEVIYTNYNAKELDITFTVPEYSEDIVFVTSDERVTVVDGCIGATGDFPEAVEVVVSAYTSIHKTEFTLTVTTFSPNRIEPAAKRYEAEGGTLTTAKQGGTVFVGDSYFTIGYWKDFYTDFADEDAYLLGVAGSVVDDWLVCSERLLYPLNPSEIILHIGFNDIYGSSAHYTPDEISERIITLLTTYNEKFPDADIYYCSVESSKWTNNYNKSFNDAPAVNAAISAYADECDWLTFVDTRYIFCDDEAKVVYGDGDGNADDNDDTGIYGQGSHPSVLAYDEYKKAIDKARGKITE